MEEVFLMRPYMHAKEIKEPWTTLDGKHTLEPKNEEFLSCLSPYPLVIEERNEQVLEQISAW